MKEEKQTDILLIPRKKVKVKRFECDSYISKSWFIDKRLDSLDAKLEERTDESGEALTSGLRSAIIKDEKGNYVRLKGVAPTTYYSQGGIRGLCSWLEADLEIQNLIQLKELGYAHMVFDADFVEKIPHMKFWSLMKSKTFLSEITYDQINSMYKNTKKLLSLSKSDNIQIIVNDSNKFERQINPEICQFFEAGSLFCYVPGYNIIGDTRLDEVIFHLTKKDYSGEKRLSRDRLVTGLCFQAGIAKALLHHINMIWSSKLDYTNNHIGNFVVYPDYGKIKIGVVDLLAAKNYTEFYNEPKKKLKELICHRLGEELQSLQEDFFDPVTCSLPTMVKYRNFPDYLKKRCADALEDGFFFSLNNPTLKNSEALAPLSRKNIAYDLPEQEFKYELNRLLR